MPPSAWRLDAARLRDRACIHHVEPSAFDDSVERSERRRREHRTVFSNKIRAEANGDRGDRAGAIVRESRPRDGRRAPGEEHHGLQRLPVAVARRNVERAREFVREQRITDRGAHVHRHISLRFARTRADMGRQQSIRHIAKWMVALERLIGECVDRRAAQVTAAQRVDQRRFVDDSAAREVRDDRARPESREFVTSDQAAGFVGERRVHREDVACLEQLGERRAAPHAQPRQSVRR